MTLTFINGGSPNYAGFVFSDTGSTLLSTIQSTLNSAGWSSISYSSGSYSSGSYLFVQGNSIVGSYPCYIYFSISNSGTSYTLTLRAYLTGTTSSGIPNGTASPASTHYLTWTSGQNNNLWLVADQESFCICIFNPTTNNCQSIHAGWLQRIDITDTNAWMIGYIGNYITSLSNWSYTYAYVASSKYNGTNWKQLSSDYNFSYIFPYSTHDSLNRIGFCSSSGTNDFSTNNSNFIGYCGRQNYDNSFLIDPYSYIEGNGSSNAYGSNNYPFNLYFRGNVKFAYCGLASLPPGWIITDPTTGYIILSAGGSGWQGMRIY